MQTQVDNAINSWLSGLAAGALEPLGQLSGYLVDPARSLLGIERVHQLWANSARVADGVYVLLVMAGGLLVMTHQSLQTRWAARQIAPRLLAGVIVSNLSWWLITHAVELSAAVAVAVAGNGMRPPEILGRLLVAPLAGGPVYLVLLMLVLVVMSVALVLALLVTAVALLVLTIIAPLALCLHALPGTEAVAWWWWRTLAAVLAIPALHAVILALLARIFLTPGSFGYWFVPPGITTASTLLSLLVVIALLYVMIKVPFWVLRAATARTRAATSRTRRGGLVRSVLKTALLGAALSATGIGPALAAGGAVGGAAGSAAGAVGRSRTVSGVLGRFLGSAAGSPLGQGRRSGIGPRAWTATAPGAGRGGPGAAVHADPDSWPSAPAGGQLRLPLPGLRRGKRRLLGPPPATPPATPPPAPSTSRGKRVYRGRQTSLWSRPALTSTAPPAGQTALPIPVTRVYRRPHYTPLPPRPSGPPPGDHPRQLALWRRVDFPAQPGPGGQYSLPLPSTLSRVPPAAPPPAAPSPAVARRPAGWVGVQLQFPIRRIPARPYRNPNPYFPPVPPRGSGR